ncbi:cation:proton antiporter [Frankia sp. AiPs1]|uniref:cation:proton antiporter n=1 Tax=Frankia sp. AiPs1 TaxID=573493 RepID=UPI0020438BD3|nr:cation:proton antiporter [Frankia sp. AiPs1]MCM3921998.1 cation:proton antiporter [Frankia sp. AiPs1]
MAAAPHADHVVAVVFADAALIIALSAVFAQVARRCRQPVVIGEILAGLALGPSLLGLLPGDLPRTLFPPDIRPYLNILSQLGLVLFMFVVGYDHDLGDIRRRGGLTTALTAASILVPFGSGIGAAAILHPWHRSVDGKAVDLLPFALFLGTAMSITALPVLARILTERQMAGDAVGRMALTCAVIGDAIGWCTLAVVVAVVNASGPWGFLRMVGELAGLVAVLAVVVAPLARVLAQRAAARADPRSVGPALLTFAVVGLLICSWATAEIGLHPVFGAFAFGTALPRSSLGRLAPDLGLNIERFGVILLPVFFVAAGLSVDLGAVDGRGLLEILLIVAVAFVAKLIGAGGAAALSGLGRRGATTFAVLMNTRGLTEIVVAQIGLDMGVLDETTFTALVVMALLTTAATSPLLDRLGIPVPPPVTVRFPRGEAPGGVAAARAGGGPGDDIAAAGHAGPPS